MAASEGASLERFPPQPQPRVSYEFTFPVLSEPSVREAEIDARVARLEAASKEALDRSNDAMKQSNDAMEQSNDAMKQNKQMLTLLYDAMKQNKQMLTLLYPFVASKLRLTAGEILKWAVQGRSEVHGTGSHFYSTMPHVQRRVLLACRAYGLHGVQPSRDSLDAFRAIAQAVISDRNDAAHIESAEELRELVKSCVSAIAVFPRMQHEYPSQCRIINRYGEFKKYLPEAFSIKSDQ